MRGQRVDAGTVVNPVAVHLGVVPGALAHCGHARHNARRDFRRNSQLTAAVKHAHHVAVLDPAFLRIQRV